MPPPREPRIMFRPLPVCSECWNRRNPGRAPYEIISGTVWNTATATPAPLESPECIDCQQPTESGIYVRMRVQWD